ncbi:S8 family serine peptidase, partial [bacterium]|nr:S8 family serine peptidase [bacterium]
MANRVLPKRRWRLGAVLPAIVFAVITLVSAWPGISWCRDGFAPGEVVVRYKRPAAVLSAESGPAEDRPRNVDSDVRSGMVPGKASGAPVGHVLPSLAKLDRKFGLQKAEHPRDRVDRKKAERIGNKTTADISNGEKVRTANRFDGQPSWRVLSFPSGADVKAIAGAYAKDPNVAFAEPNYIGSLGYTPGDPAYSGRQSGLYDELHLEEAWDIQKGDPSVIVAVIDSGVDVNHPDLAGVIAPGGWDFAEGDGDLADDLGHGTRVAGIIAAVENGQGGVGAAFGCRILPFDVSDSRGQVRVTDVVAAIEEAVSQGALVINLSLSFRFDSELLQEACAVASESAVIVAAAGNDGQGDSPRYPASCDGILGVGAVDQDGGCAIFSNFNGRCDSLVDLVAPGVGVYATTPGGGWSGGAEASGTSFAAPFVSASAALLRAQHPEQSPAAIARHLEKTADKQSAFKEYGAFWRYSFKREHWGMGAYFGHDHEQGSGLVNPQTALETPMIPTLSVRAVSVVDDRLYSPINDGDGELDQGEIVRLRVEIACSDNDALNLVTRLKCADSRVVLMDGGTTATELSVSLKALRCGRVATLTFSNVQADAAAGRGDLPFTLVCLAGTDVLPDLAFSVRIENKVAVSGPQPDIHFTNDNAYIVTDDLTLSGICLIDPDTPFTIYPGKRIRLLSGGNLTAVGTEAAPIAFTSLHKIPDLSLVPPTPD